MNAAIISSILVDPLLARLIDTGQSEIMAIDDDQIAIAAPVDPMQLPRLMLHLVLRLVWACSVSMAVGTSPTKTSKTLVGPLPQG